MTVAPIRLILSTSLLTLSGGICLQTALAFDERSPPSQIGSVRISVSSYERIPIATLLAHPDRYQMRDIRITGTVMTSHTETVPNRMICGSPHERTALTLEDDSGQIEVIDQGACGKNVGALKAPRLIIGQQIDLLVQIMIPANTGTPGLPVEATIRYIEPVRD